MSVQWADPPRQDCHWMQTACDELRTRPGEWAMIRTSDDPGYLSSYRYNLTHGTRSYTRPAGSFEAKTRKLDDGFTYGLFVRYIGEA